MSIVFIINSFNSCLSLPQKCVKSKKNKSILGLIRLIVTELLEIYWILIKDYKKELLIISYLIILIKIFHLSFPLNILNLYY
jgi:hypothetical protein